MVRKVGVEPTRYCYHQILSLERLPIPPLSHNGSPSRIRTYDSLINSQVLYQTELHLDYGVNGEN